MRKASVTFGILVLAWASAGWSTQYDYDELNRLTKVTYDNGDTVSYVYDPAGNITRVTSEGRCSTSLQGFLEEDDLSRKRRDGDDNEYRFIAIAEEPVTIRFEAVPPEAGVGKFAELVLMGEADDDLLSGDDDDFRRKVESALPTEVMAVLPFAGEYRVRVREADDDDESYAGPYRLTLEASPGACASFEVVPDDLRPPSEQLQPTPGGR